MSCGCSLGVFTLLPHTCCSLLDYLLFFTRLHHTLLLTTERIYVHVTGFNCIDRYDSMDILFSVDILFFCKCIDRYDSKDLIVSISIDIVCIERERYQQVSIGRCIDRYDSTDLIVQISQSCVCVCVCVCVCLDMLVLI